MQYLIDKYALPETTAIRDWVEEDLTGIEHSQETLHIIDLVTAEEARA
jgi:hypothetical protein